MSMSRSSSSNSSSRSSRSSSSRSLLPSSSAQVEYLYEYEYLDESSKIPVTDLPLVNPYTAFVKPPSAVTKITKLFHTPRPSSVLEYVQASRFDQCFVPATDAEQLFPLELPPELPHQWQQKGYTHLHFGAVRIALSFHGRKGLPVTSRIALLDTRFQQYQHACIATVQTTLNAGTVVFTFFPNFNMPLKDPHLLNALQIQIQINGASAVSTTYAATLHYQMAYRLQNHAMDMCLPTNVSQDALLLDVNTQHQATCTHIPKQLSKAELYQLLPDSWVTSYEKMHQQPKPLQSSNPTCITKPDGTVSITFPKPGASSTALPIFSSKLPEVNMMCFSDLKNQVPISKFQSSGDPIYFFQDPLSGHKYFDACDCDECLMDLDDDEPSKRKKKSSQYRLQKRYDDGDPTVGLLGEPSGKFDYYVEYGKPKKLQPKPSPPACKPPYIPCTPKQIPPPDLPPAVPCYMFSPSSSWTEDDFPPFAYHDDKEHTTHQHKIPDSTVIQPDGSSNSVVAAEAVINWQSANALAQNKILQRISRTQQSLEASVNRRLSSLELLIHDLQQKIQGLHTELLQMAYANQAFTSAFVAKDAEMKHLKTQLQSLQAQQLHQQFHPPDLFSPAYTTPFFPSYTPQPMSQPLHIAPSGHHSLFGSSPITSVPPAKPPIISSTVRSSSTSPSTSSDNKPKPDTKGKAPAPTQFMIDSDVPAANNPISKILFQLADHQNLTPDTGSDSDAPGPFPFIYMADPPPPPDDPIIDEVEDPVDVDDPAQLPRAPQSNFHSPPGGQGFSIDDLPRSKWLDKFYEIHAWCSAEMLSPNANLRTVLTRSVSKFLGRLRQWYVTLGEYRQLQLVQAPSINAFIDAIHNEFLGSTDGILSAAREEFFSMRCCSFKRKDLESHFLRMSQRFYILGGIDDVNLKQSFLKSLPEPLGDETFKLLQTKNMALHNTTLGAIYQHVLQSLEKLCNYQKFFKTLHEQGRLLGKACDRPDLLIKCKGTGSCTCSSSPSKKKHFEKWKPRSSFPKTSRKKKWRFFRKKSVRGIRKSDRCYICRKKGHYAKQCPNKTARTNMIQTLSQVLPLDDDADIESVFSFDDEASPTTIMAFSLDDSDSDDSVFSTSDEECLPNLFSFEFSISPALLVQPLAQIKVFPEKYSHPISVIAFFDTGAAATIMNPAILPRSYWQSCYFPFTAANGETFAITLKSKPILLQIFPGVQIKHQVLGSDLPNKDILIGFDILQKLSHVSWLPKGLKYKNSFLPWTTQPNLFHITSNITSLQEDITRTSCADSHSQFLTICDKPLWKNPDFFISLPFKKNEDLNPTKATHHGMNPDHYQLAIQELNQLQSEGLVEPTISQWACEAFYVNKRAEQVRGKLRLVINYQPLNHFLQDIKFPLPRRTVMFANLPNAKVFSKFDLKAGFWQLGIQPDERPKTGFCIPDHHFQWTVMPFGLKTAPSLFQQAMIKIFDPILMSTLIYIDDILLFSPDLESHTNLLQTFHQLVLKFGVMLSAKKMILAQPEIEFLGMKISQGQYTLQPHIATQLLQFPDDTLTFKQVQQFLGIVTYMAEFIPNLAPYRKPLSALLKKNPPPWSSSCTEAVKYLKSISQTLPPLQIPSAGKRILQTDASDLYWGAVLLEEFPSQPRSICGYKSGAFTSAETHYHSTYKEILAIKRGIEKFEFHLIGHHFLIETDLSSFPNMLKFKQKHPPRAQLLRWANWFSQWSFDAAHIQGKSNVLPDFLSRLKKEISPICFPMVSCFEPLQFPFHLQVLLLEQTLIARSCDMVTSLQFIYVHRYGLEFGPVRTMPFHPVYPFLTHFEINPSFYFHFSKELYLLLWYLVDLYHIGIILDKSCLLQYLAQCLFNNLSPDQMKFCSWLTLFGDISFWQDQLRRHPFQNPMFVFWSSKRFLPAADNGVLLDKRFHVSFFTGHENIIAYELSGPFNVFRTQICHHNGISPQSISPYLFHQATAHWRSSDFYPEDWRQKMIQVLANHEEQYSWDLQNPDHPMYRVHLRPYPLIQDDEVPGYNSEEWHTDDWSPPDW